MADIDKIIVTNKSALIKKYGASFSRIEAAIERMIVADGKRGIDSKLILLDDAAVKNYGAVPVQNAESGPENKRAIDAVFRFFQPDYIMILGSRDVVGHVKLSNLTNDEDGVIIDSDLPYACENGYTRDGRKFLSPTRVVGRLPDITGGRDAGYLVRLIDQAVVCKTLTPADYSGWFALSAKEWTGSTTTSCRNMFGNASNLLLSPAASGPYSQLSRTRVHFFNCHGGLRDEHFFGQSGNNYPIAFQSGFISSRLKSGTFVAAECCYGAELYQPAAGQGMSISNKYMFQNAAAYVGSTTVAYGPADGQGSADLITQYFVINVLKGYSTGRALLEARQKFINVSGPHIDAVELKTIMQFLLLGDPSLHLLQTGKTEKVLADGGKIATVDQSKLRSYRKARRNQLYENGQRVGKTTKAPQRDTGKISPAKHKKFAAAIRELGIDDFEAMAFRYGNKKSGIEKHYFYKEKKKDGDKRKGRVLIFKESGDDIVVRVYERK